MDPDNPGIDHRSPFSEEALREIAKEKVLWKLGVQVHVLGFVIVNLLLVAINIVADPGEIWFPYVLSCWATGLAIHVAVYLIYSRGIIGTNRRGLILSSVIVAMASQSLFVINYFSGFSYKWFLWPVGALIAALIVYAVVCAIIIGPDEAGGVKRSWLEKRIDKEIQKAKDLEKR